MPGLADRIGAAVCAHPSVARLDGGPFGTVSTALPGRRVVGVAVRGAVGGPGEDGVSSGGRGVTGVEVSVVLRADRPIPPVLAELRDLVRAEAGPVAVDVHVSDVEES